MTLTPREYLHQHFGPKDRKWIESLSDERCWEVVALASGMPATAAEYEKIYRESVPRQFAVLSSEDIRRIYMESIVSREEALHPLPDVPGEYPDWR